MSELVEGSLFSGRYVVGPVLGRGGMSVVREAEDVRMSRRVALKFVRHEHSPELTERLFREAKAAARSDHPSVVLVFDYGTDESTGLDYLVMERLEGEDLAARIARLGLLPTVDVLRLGAEVADALDHVHASGVVHRDLKPSNVFVTRRNGRERLKLLDFGLAKQLDLHSLTGTGQVLGSLAYMAPEQIMDSKRVDLRSDLFSLGVLLLECATGQLPYRVETAEDLMRRVLFDAAPPALLATLDVALREIVSRCLERKPSKRYKDAGVLRDALISAGA
jgi:serine/threonine protein kinase